MKYLITVALLMTSLTTLGNGLPDGHPEGGASILPADHDIPKDEFGKMVRQGQLIFSNTGQFAGAYVGNDLSCRNCHLDQGRKAGSAPLWAAFLSYPAYRAKNHRVNTFAERLQECFVYSMNGKAPPLGDPILVALESYAYWMEKNAKINPLLQERGIPQLQKPGTPPSYERGKTVYANNCALCHGTSGQGRRANDGHMVFPPLWGDRSFNWGAGMAHLNKAAAYIKTNMPLSLGGSLSDQDAWDVAYFMDGHNRPQDPRYTGSVDETRALFHRTQNSLYGHLVAGHVLGNDPVSKN
ncbi:c-type cytochrome [Ferrovum myxofaciens]|uniref:c-type cytochrome n=1 Tax=Ferrovum myxofaciens TaxID=416213 RepID=UPI000A682F2E|nr:c-type cytochrome [Ferrovum myxofaciens]